MNNDDYIVIHGWMMSELGLSGKKLLIYALIHGYSKDGIHEFFGSLDYIGKWIGSKRNNVCTLLRELVSDGLLSKREEVVNGVKQNYYSVIKIITGCSKNHNRGVLKIRTNNIIDNIIDIKETNSIEFEKKRSFLKPSVEDVNAYIKKMKYHIDGATFVDFYDSKGWMIGKNRMKDWKAACRTWERKWKKDNPDYVDQHAQDADDAVNTLNFKKWQS